MRLNRLTPADVSPRGLEAIAAQVRALAKPPAGLSETVREIFAEVAADGDAAVRERNRRYGEDAAAGTLRVPPAELAAALAGLDPPVRAGLEVAIANVGQVAAAELHTAIGVDLPQGQRVDLLEIPVRRAGVYVPGGRASYPSSVVMCCIPARVAGVGHLTLATPASRAGRADPTVLGACALCGVDEVHLMGGAQAIAALALGTQTIAPVDIIVGPGNAYVQEAKRQAVGRVGIDGIAGPSELVVVADGEADPRLVALDLAAQAEHGPDSLVILISPSDRLLEQVAEAAATVAVAHPSVSDAPLALVAVPSIDIALALANAIAPEHLELACAQARQLAAKVETAGCVFLGYNGGTAFGDYAAGSNHVLPTGGAARFAGPLGATTFRRRQALVSLPAEAAGALAPHVGNVARAEGYPVHAESAEARAASSSQ